MSHRMCNTLIPDLQLQMAHRIPLQFAGTITLFADCQFPVVVRASLVCSRVKRCVTIEANGNCSGVARRNSMAARKWRGSLDHEPNTWSCLRVMTCGLNAIVPASQ